MDEVQLLRQEFTKVYDELMRQREIIDKITDEQSKLKKDMDKLQRKTGLKESPKVFKTTEPEKGQKNLV